MTPGQAQETRPVKRLRRRGANGLCPTIGGRPHRTSGGQPELWRERGHRQPSPTPSRADRTSNAVRLFIHANSRSLHVVASLLTADGGLAASRDQRLEPPALT